MRECGDIYALNNFNVGEDETGFGALRLVPLVLQGHGSTRAGQPCSGQIIVNFLISTGVDYVLAHSSDSALAVVADLGLPSDLHEYQHCFVYPPHPPRPSQD